MKPVFCIGDRVWLLHLKEEGIVTKLQNDGLLYVQVSGDEIPVYGEDVSKEIPVLTDKEVLPKPEEGESEKPKVELKGSDKGVFIAFLPQQDKSGDTKEFYVHLINDLAYVAAFDYNFYLGDDKEFSVKNVIQPYQDVLLHVIEYDWLNEMPSFIFSFHDTGNEKRKGMLHQKMKPQSFFNKIAIAPLLNVEAHLYSIPELKSEIQEADKNKIQFDAEALKQMILEMPVSKDGEAGEVITEIDLHIEAFTKNYGTLSNSEMLELQLQHFQRAFENAIVQGAQKFYAVHGVGKGRLKNEIHRLLKEYKEVKSFNNDFNPQYGYGATEIILK